MIRRYGIDEERGAHMGDGLWIIILEMVLVLVLAAFIVWWTMGGRHKRDEKPRPDDAQDR